jgi:hypothetical protein
VEPVTNKRFPATVVDTGLRNGNVPSVSMQVFFDDAHADVPGQVPQFCPSTTPQTA